MKTSRLSLIFFFLLACSCANNPQPSVPSSYLGKTIILPDEIKSLSAAPYKIIVYLDPGECVSCELKSLRLFDEDLNLFRELNDINQCLDIIFIINHGRDEAIDSVLAGLNDLFPLKIYYDDSHLFTGNFTPPVEKQYHCFLLDDSDTVRLIGFPYMNPSLKAKYVSCIFAH